MKTTVSDIRGRAGQGGAISLGVKTFDSVVSGKLDGFFSGPNSFFPAEKKQAGCCENMVVIHKKSSIHLGQEAISKIRSCFYIEEEQNKYNSTKVQLESLRSGNWWDCRPLVAFATRLGTGKQATPLHDDK